MYLNSQDLFVISKAVHYIFSGLPLHFVEKWKQFDDAYHPRLTILKVPLCVGSLTTGAVDVISQMAVNAYLDENIFFLIHEHNESEMMQKKRCHQRQIKNVEELRRQYVSSIDIAPVSNIPKF